MRLEGRRSGNVVDVRGRGGMPMVAGGGIGMVILVVVALFFGVDPSALLENQTGPAPAPQAGAADAPKDPLSDFVSVVLADTEDTWNAVFREKLGRDYQEPQLVLFTGAVQSACGFAQAAMGPFYCPVDGRVYIDLAFYRELRDRFHAPGDLAQAYVIAHEVGHHVQNQLGIAERVTAAQQRAGRGAEANALSVRQELQADCMAGLWAHHAQRARNVVEPGDIEEALGAATAIGDDRMQQRSRGYVVPDSFTHGSSAQRMTWFKRGFESGQLEACDTFGGSNAAQVADVP